MRHRYHLLAFAIGSLASIQAGAQTASALESIALQIPGRDMRINPPAVQSVTVTPMGLAGDGMEKGLLKVRFEETGLPPSLRIIYKGQVTLLHDDGVAEDVSKDGAYSAMVTFDLGEMVEHQIKLNQSGAANSLQSLAAASQNALEVSRPTL